MSRLTVPLPSSTVFPCIPERVPRFGLRLGCESTIRSGSSDASVSANDSCSAALPGKTAARVLGAQVDPVLLFVDMGGLVWARSCGLDRSMTRRRLGGFRCTVGGANKLSKDLCLFIDLHLSNLFDVSESRLDAQPQILGTGAVIIQSPLKVPKTSPSSPSRTVDSRNTFFPSFLVHLCNIWSQPEVNVAAAGVNSMVRDAVTETPPAALRVNEDIEKLRTRAT